MIWEHDYLATDSSIILDVAFAMGYWLEWNEAIKTWVLLDKNDEWVGDYANLGEVGIKLRLVIIPLCNFRLVRQEEWCMN